MHNRCRCKCELKNCRNSEESQMQVSCPFSFTGCSEATPALCEDTQQIVPCASVRTWVDFQPPINSRCDCGLLESSCLGARQEVLAGQLAYPIWWPPVKNSWRRDLWSTSGLHTYACTPIHVPAKLQLIWSGWYLMHITPVLWVHECHSNAVSGRQCFTTVFYILLWVTLNLSIITLRNFLLEQNLLLSYG